MKPQRLFALLALSCLAAAPSFATAPAAGHRAAPAAVGEDPFRPVYVLMSRKTWQAGLDKIVREAQPRHDSVGTELVLARIQEHQLGDLSRFVHQNERRCGGYFAFDTAAQAEAFLRADRSREAVLAPAAVSYTIDNQATVNPWLPQVGEPNLHNTISFLSTNWANRYYASTQGKDAATWIRDNWLSLANGRSDVSAQLYTGCSNCSTQPSVILTIQGNELASEVVVLGGHLDSISSTGSGNSMNAPGADDDGSGIATLTEVLRIAMANGWKPKRTVKFMGYAAEEVGLRGSAAIAADYKAQGVNVVGVMQFDMTDYREGSSFDMQLITDYSNAALQQFTRDLFDTYLKPSGMTRGTYTCGYACSDHASWTNNGFPSAFMFEGGDNPVIHTPDDNLATLDNTAQPAVALAKLGLAFLGELAKTSSTIAGTPTANFSYTTNSLTANFTDGSSDSDGNIVSRSWNFGDGTSSTATNPAHTYPVSGTYNVTLTVTDNSNLTGARTQAVQVTTNVLSNGVALTGLSAPTGGELNFTMPVPANSTNLKFATANGTGNADLYVRFGAAPTDSTYDCRPFRAGNMESCSFATPAAGTWYVRLKARSAFGNVKLTPTYTSGSGGGGGSQTYNSTGAVAIPDNGTVDSPITVSGRTGNALANTAVAVNITHAKRGDLRIRLIAPDGTAYVLKAANSGDTAPNVVTTYTVNLSSEALNGTWKLRVADVAAGNTGTINSWSLSF